MKGLLIEAGAGCGKTYSIVSKYIEALGYDPESGKPLKQSSLSPSDIWLLTFTEDAAEEMMERILSRLSEKGLTSLRSEVIEYSTIGTIHSLCYKVLRPHLKTLGYPDLANIVSSPVANLHRTRHIISSLASFESTNKLLKSFEISEIIKVSLKLWHENVELQTNSLKQSFTQLSNEFLRKYRQLENEVAAAHAHWTAKKESNLGWLAEAQECFRSKDRELFEKLAFNRGSKQIKASHPALFDSLNRLREAFRSGVDLILSEDFHQRELEALALFGSFLKHCQFNAPKLLDFNALEFELSLLLKNPQFPKPRAPKLLIVDEFQDTSPVQAQILEALSGVECETCVVGDPKQSIYGFRGADTSVFNKYKSQLKNSTLSVSRRSDKALLNFQNSFQNALFSQHKTPYDPPPQKLEAWDKLSERAALKTQSPSEIIWATDKEDIFTKVSDAFLKRKSESSPPSTHAVLFLKWKEVYEFSEYCRLHKIPFVLNVEGIIEDHHLTQGFSLFLKNLLNPDSSDFALFLERFGPKNQNLQIKIPPHLKFEKYSILFGHFCSLVDPHRWSLGQYWTASMSRLILDLESSLPAFDSTLEDLLRVIESGRDLSPSLPELDSSRNPPDTLILTSIHSSKGLEYDFVYLPELPTRLDTRSSFHQDEDLGFTLAQRLRFGNRPLPTLQGLLPRHKKSWQEFSEKKRLLYVAITRAKRGLSLFPILKVKSTAEKPGTLSFLGFENPPKNTLALWIDAARVELLNFSQDWEEQLPSTDLSKKENENVEPPRTEIWNYPLETTKNTYKAYEENILGVNQYLKQYAKVEPRKYFPKPQNPEETSTKLQNTTELGTKMHQCLEIWNGSLESLPHLTSDFEPSEASLLSMALRSLHELPILKDYFLDLQKNPQNVLRELPIMSFQQGKTLLGICDSLWIHNQDEATLIDWKGSHQMSSLEKNERLESIRAQLNIYAQAFKKSFKNLRILAVGVELGASQTKAKLLFEERFN